MVVETNPRTRTMNEYITTLSALFALLITANKADGKEAKEWQQPNDALLTLANGGKSTMYTGIWEAIASIAGYEILEHWAYSNEIDFNLANRIKSLKS